MADSSKTSTDVGRHLDCEALITNTHLQIFCHPSYLIFNQLLHGTWFSSRVFDRCVPLELPIIQTASAPPGPSVDWWIPPYSKYSDQFSRSALSEMSTFGGMQRAFKIGSQRPVKPLSHESCYDPSQAVLPLFGAPNIHHLRLTCADLINLWCLFVNAFAPIQKFIKFRHMAIYPLFRIRLFSRMVS